MILPENGKKAPIYNPGTGKITGEVILSNAEETKRVNDELMMFNERNLIIVLKYIKYVVDTMRANHIVWGVGRGSSLASFVLFLIGINKVNPLLHNLDIHEFLR